LILNNAQKENAFSKNMITQQTAKNCESNHKKLSLKETTKKVNS